MSRNPNAEMQVLLPNKFNEYCSVLGIKEMCCLEPEKKAIEKAFRRKALKCHPDKGGDPIEFKKLNDAYNKLVGHISKLEQQAEAIELANSVLIEISTTSVKNWQSKLQTRYGWFKSENCKNIIFDGPYRQYMGRSKNTGNITVVLYEDPPDAIPKIHIRSSKYMAWIAEAGMPVHMHVEKGRQLAFDQWRIAHLAEYGIYNFGAAPPATPAPERKAEKPPKTPKSKRKGRDASDPSKPKARRDSEPTPEPPPPAAENKENTQPSEPAPSHERRRDESSFAYNCGHCGAGFANLLDYVGHKQKCVPDEEFGEAQEKKKTNANSTSETPNSSCNPKFECSKCKETFTNMVWYSKHQGSCTYTAPEEDEYAQFMKAEPQPEKIIPEKTTESTGNKIPEQKNGETTKTTEQTKEEIKTRTGNMSTKTKHVPEPVKKATEGAHMPYKTNTPGVQPSDKSPGAVKVTEKEQKSKKDTTKNIEQPIVEEKETGSQPVRKFSAIIPDEPPQNFMEVSQKDIPRESCDQKKNNEVKHSKNEDFPNDVAKSCIKKTKGCESKLEHTSKKTSNVTKLKDGPSDRVTGHENVTITDDGTKTKKPDGLGTKTGKVSKSNKADTGKFKNGINKTIDTSKPSTTKAPKPDENVEAMEIDGMNSEELRVNGKCGSDIGKDDCTDLGSPRDRDGRAANTTNTGNTGNTVKFTLTPHTKTYGNDQSKENQTGKDVISVNSEKDEGPKGLVENDGTDKMSKGICNGTQESKKCEDVVKSSVGDLTRADGGKENSGRHTASEKVLESVAGHLDTEAIRLTNTFLHQSQEPEEEEEVFVKNVKIVTNPASNLSKQPTKSILKKPTSMDKLIPVLDLPKPTEGNETTEYHLTEKVSQYDATPHKVEKVATKKKPDQSLKSNASTSTQNTTTTNNISKSTSCGNVTNVPNSESKPVTETHSAKGSTIIPNNSNLKETPIIGSNVATTTTNMSKPITKVPVKVSPMAENNNMSKLESFVDVMKPTTPGSIEKSVPTVTAMPLNADKTSATTNKDKEVKHAEQRIIVNTPCSPQSKQKENPVKTGEANTLSHLSGRSLSGERNADTSCTSGQGLKAELDQLDQKHSNNMKKVSENQSSSAVKDVNFQSYVQPSIVSRASTATNQTYSSSLTTSSREKLTTSYPNVKTPNGKTVDSEKSPYVGSQTPPNSVLKNVTTDLKKLDDVHTANMKQIGELFKEEDLKTRRPPSTDHHSSRPTTLGRSRFDSSPGGSARAAADAKVLADSMRTQYVMEHHVPKRNESVHDMTNSGTSSSYAPVTRSSTLANITESSKVMSPDLSFNRRKFDRNFNASPEPFTSHKPTEHVHFSDPPVSSFKYPSSGSHSSSKTSNGVSNTSSHTKGISSSKSFSDIGTFSKAKQLPSNSSSSYASPITSSYSNSSFPSPSTYNFTPQSSSSSIPLASSSSFQSRHTDPTSVMSKMSSGDLAAKIQATKDQHKMDIKKAMDFDKTTIKPPMITAKLPRPDAGKYQSSSSTISMTNQYQESKERASRRMEREKAVINRVLSDRGSRGKSDDLLLSKSASNYRF